MFFLCSRFQLPLVDLVKQKGPGPGSYHLIDSYVFFLCSRFRLPLVNLVKQKGPWSWQLHFCLFSFSSLFLVKQKGPWSMVHGPSLGTTRQHKLFFKSYNITQQL